VGTRKLSRGQHNIRWIEDYCRIPEGKDVGKPVRLRPFQKKIIRGIYDTPTRTAIVSMAKKNAKTSLSAFLLLLHLEGPEARRNSQLASTAQSREQAAVLFDLAAKIVRMSPDLLSVTVVRETQKELACPELGTVYKALSAEASTAHGKSTIFAVHDELGQVRGPRSALYEAVENAMGAHDEPLSIVISTQAPTDADLLSILIDDALAGHDPMTKIFIWTADPEKFEDPFSRAALKAANPALGDFLNEKEVLRQADQAKRMPSKEASYRNYQLNQRVNMQNPLISEAVWRANGGQPDESAFYRYPVRLGLDLSARNDLTALAMEADDGQLSHVKCEFWTPEKGLEERARRDRVPYDLWVKQGHMHACAGASVDYDTVAQRVVEICEKYQVISIAFDRYRIDVFKAALDRLGVELPLVPHGQGYKDMTPAIDTLESRLLNLQVRHGMNPVLRMCAANTVADTDPAGNRKPNKARSTGRIDGIVALAMAMNHQAVEPEMPVTGRLIAV